MPCKATFRYCGFIRWRTRAVERPKVSGSETKPMLSKTSTPQSTGSLLPKWIPTRTFVTATIFLTTCGAISNGSWRSITTLSIRPWRCFHPDKRWCFHRPVNGFLFIKTQGFQTGFRAMPKWWWKISRPSWLQTRKPYLLSLSTIPKTPDASFMM